LERLPTYPRRSIPPTVGNRPAWLKVRPPGGPGYLAIQRTVREQGLHTVCEEARCPNRGECWEQGTATFLLLGDVCTRACGFCNIATGRPGAVDLDEPERVADAVEAMGLRHAVLTAVTRDDLPDGGASIFAASVRAIRARVVDCTIELLIPDLGGDWDALAAIMESRPEILNHNVETVPRLYGRVRPKAIFPRSLELLRRARALDPQAITKSGLMVGLGETRDELVEVFSELRDSHVDVLTIGQYLRPSAWHLPVARYYAPTEFAELKADAMARGFRHVEAGPLVRSSYHAREQIHGGDP
jgi:lipoyl synthase